MSGENPAREKIGSLKWAIVLSGLLCGVKGTAAFFCASQALLASALDSFMDAGISSINFLSVKKAAVKLKLEVEERAIKSADELRKSITNLQPREGDTLFHIPDDLIESQAEFIIEAAREKRWPTMFSDESLVTKGGLASYEPSYYQMGRAGARLAGKILKGAKPQELPVERAGKFDLLINLRTANGIGLSIPGALLKRADRVIR